MHHQNWDLVQNIQILWHNNLKMNRCLGALITYHRSDSNKMKKSEVDSLRQIISKEIGENFLSKEEIIYKEKSKFVQQGHEAVTPTQLQKPEDVKKN